MREGVVESLETQLAEARQQWQQAEEHGAEIAERAQTRIAELEARVEDLLSERSCSDSTECKTCGFLMMLLAHTASALMLMVWLSSVKAEAPPNFGSFFGWLLACSGPTILFWGNWAWKRFKRRHSWNAWNDNDYYNKVARWLEP